MHNLEEIIQSIALFFEFPEAAGVYPRLLVFTDHSGAVEWDVGDETVELLRFANLEELSQKLGALESYRKIRGLDNETSGVS